VGTGATDEISGLAVGLSLEPGLSGLAYWGPYWTGTFPHRPFAGPAQSSVPRALGRSWILQVACSASDCRLGAKMAQSSTRPDGLVQVVMADWRVAMFQPLMKSAW
tara:strand:+ start:9844 stop:10161 length:318 start_codon:yes stop_codon:yes gene_type:complete